MTFDQQSRPLQKYFQLKVNTLFCYAALANSREYFQNNYSSIK